MIRKGLAFDSEIMVCQSLNWKFALLIGAIVYVGQINNQFTFMWTECSYL